MSANLASRLKSELIVRYSLSPSDQWLNSFLASIHNLSVPLPALTSTANFRLLTTDIRTSLTAGGDHVFPSSLGDVNTKEAILAVDAPVQVLDIQDTSTSKWSQIEAIERFERGEEIRGREVIRNVPGATGDDESSHGEHDQTSTARPGPFASNQIGTSEKGSTGPHKLLLQDAAGTKMWAFEVERIDRITIINSNPPVLGSHGSSSQTTVEGMQVGCKLMLKKGTKVRRALIMLSPVTATVMGGKVEIWDKKWRESRKAMLQQELERENACNG